MQILIDLGANLGRFWEGFGGQVGPKLAPNGNKPWPHNQSKIWSLFGRPPERFLMISGPNLGPTWANLASKTLPKFSIRGAAGRPFYPSPPKSPPRPSQDSPRPFQDLSKTPQDTPKTCPKASKMLEEPSQDPARTCSTWGTNTKRKSTDSSKIYKTWNTQ